MAHSIVKGIDRMASTRLDTVWHATETAADGRLVQVPASDDLEATLLTMGGIVWPTDADNEPVREHKAATLAQAMAWLAKQHSYAPVWVRNRMGDYIDAQVNHKFPIQRQPQGEPHADGAATHA